MRVLMARCDGATSDHFALVAPTPSPAFLPNQMSFTWRRSTVAFSKPPITDEHGIRFSTINQPARSAPSRCRFRIRTLFTSAVAKVCIGPISRSVMESTNRRTGAKPGPKAGWKNPNASRGSRSLKEKATQFSRQFPARSGAIRRTAVSTNQSTAGKPGNRF